MNTIFIQIKNISFYIGVIFCTIFMYEACRPEAIENNNGSITNPNPTGSLSDTALDAIDPKINPKGAREDSISGKINGSTSGNNTGRTE